MMITDLIDQDDFFEFLQGAGVQLDQGWTPEQCSQAALAWLVEQDETIKTQFAIAVAELKEKESIMLPEVRTALAILIEE
ncbi:hypothetical protein [Amphritea sp. HPY]|uniref:hypothetical protein n=1 Tax=Amphritea sp. HPY TaxID=3421652 RepID=UPI003D7DDA05